jgi:hypothetical protein
MRLAVFIDADNMAAALAPRIFEHLSKLGRPAILRAFGGPSAMADWETAGRVALCEMRLQNNVAAGKNGTDIAMALDAMDVLHSNGADTFCIVSNDRDFVPLAVRLRASVKRVHAICKHADDRYRKAFDEVIELDQADHPYVAAFRQIADGRPDLSLSEVGVVLRQLFRDEIPTGGKAPLRRSLEATGKFDLFGTGPAIRVRLKN